MFDFLKRLFGEGKIRLVGETVDGRTFTVKVPYIGSLDTEEEELLEEVVAKLYVEYGVVVTRLKIDGVYGTTTEQPNWSCKWHQVQMKKECK